MPHSSPLQFLLNPWHAVTMLFSPPSYEKPQEPPSPLEDDDDEYILTKQKYLNVWKSAFLLSNYVGAGKKVRKLNDLKRNLAKMALRRGGVSEPVQQWGLL